MGTAKRGKQGTCPARAEYPISKVGAAICQLIIENSEVIVLVPPDIYFGALNSPAKVIPSSLDIPC